MLVLLVTSWCFGTGFGAGLCCFFQQGISFRKVIQSIYKLICAGSHRLVMGWSYTGDLFSQGKEERSQSSLTGNLCKTCLWAVSPCCVQSPLRLTQCLVLALMLPLLTPNTHTHTHTHTHTTGVFRCFPPIPPAPPLPHSVAVGAGAGGRPVRATVFAKWCDVFEQRLPPGAERMRWCSV